jgi:hypothetical protein
MGRGEVTKPIPVRIGRNTGLRIPKRKADKIIAAYVNGMSVRGICRAYGTNWAAVSSLIRYKPAGGKSKSKMGLAFVMVLLWFGPRNHNPLFCWLGGRVLFWAEETGGLVRRNPTLWTPTIYYFKSDVSAIPPRRRDW